MNARQPRTRAGRALLERETYNSRSFAIVRVDDILAIEAEACGLAERDDGHTHVIGCLQCGSAIEAEASDALRAALARLRQHVEENGAFDWLGTGTSTRDANAEERDFWRKFDAIVADALSEPATVAGDEPPRFHDGGCPHMGLRLTVCDDCGYVMDHAAYASPDPTAEPIGSAGPAGDIDVERPFTPDYTMADLHLAGCAGGEFCSLDDCLCECHSVDDLRPSRSHV